MSLKNRYFAIIYGECLKNTSIKKIHKKLFDETINSKVQDKLLLGFAIKTANKAHKLVAIKGEGLASLIYDLFKKEKSNDKAKKIINYQVGKEAEKEKLGKLNDFIEQSKLNGKWFYLASSHNDCAKDHIPYQGRLYVDKNAPKQVLEYAKGKGLYTMQWVIDAPAYFITRPNCRHYFVSLSYKEVEGKSVKKLINKHHTHTDEGNREFQTPPKIAVEEYTDRLRMLRALYQEHPTPELKIEIEKTELLLKKWKRQI